MPTENLVTLFGEATLSIETLTAVLGWCTVFNLGLLVFSTIMLFTLKESIKSFHSKISGLPGEQLDQAYFQYLAQFKLLFLFFNLVPYLALRIFIL